jgi:hypothetical protein
MTSARRLAALALALAASTAFAGDKAFSVGFKGHDRTQAADVGLPVYPGALPHSDSDGDKSAATVGLWAGMFGLELNVMKFRVAAAPERVAAFYADALARHGNVLDCRDAAARVKPPKDSDRLSCDSAPKAGDYEYRVGSARQFRVVSVKRDGDGARFDLVHIDLRR